MGRVRLRTLFVALAALWTASCDLLLGLDAPQPYPSGTTTGTTTTLMTTTTTDGGGASSTTMSTAGGAGGGGCEPGLTVSCYDGPAATEGVGICKSGQQTCLSDGSAFGLCENAVMPQEETCVQSQDEDCDNYDCALWAVSFGDTSDQFPTDVALDPAGNIVVTGAFSGALAVSDPPLVSAGFDLFVAKLDPNGKPLWARKFGDAATQLYAAVAAADDGAILLTGGFLGSVNFGGETLSSVGASDIFVAKLDANGAHVWSRRFGGSNKEVARDVTVDGAGNVLVCGGFIGTFDFGKGPLTSTGAAPLQDVFLVKLDGATGEALWGRRFGDGSDQMATQVVADGSGNIVMSGRYYGTLDFGVATVTQSDADSDLFVARFDDLGNAIWAKGYASSFSLHATKVDAFGRITIGGWFSGTVNLGEGNTSSGPQPRLFVLRLDSTGAPLWNRTFGGDDFGPIPAGLVSAGVDLAVTAAGDVSLAAHAKGPIDFGGGLLGGSSSQSDFLAKLDADGKHLWSRRFGEVAESGYCVVSTTKSDQTVLACSVKAPGIDYGRGELPLAGGLDMTLAKFGP